MGKVSKRLIVLCKGKVLKEFKLRFDHEKDFAIKTTQLGLFDLQFGKEIDFLTKTTVLVIFASEKINWAEDWDICFFLLKFAVR